MIIVRERARETKLEGHYKERKGVLLENSNNTITFLKAGRTQSTVISERDIGWIKADTMPCCSNWSNIQNKARANTSETESTTTNENKATTPLFDALASELTYQSDEQQRPNWQTRAVLPNRTWKTGKNTLLINQ